jgi:hypothetical protein
MELIGVFWKPSNHQSSHLPQQVYSVWGTRKGNPEPKVAGESGWLTQVGPSV